ncbi:MAG TPA: phage holin family protein [Kofleriaceae bacterium]|nr:phage holin family protein [Kofleriaceae bacterium]
MDGATGVLIKLGVRLLVFGAVFWFATRKNPKVVIGAKWITPIVALVFAVLNTGLYWILKPILNLATMGAVGFALPFVINMLLLLATVKLFTWKRLPKLKVKSADPKQPAAEAKPRPWLEIHGLFTTLWMAMILTVAHGALWVALDYLPKR